MRVPARGIYGILLALMVLGWVLTFWGGIPGSFLFAIAGAGFLAALACTDHQDRTSWTLGRSWVFAFAFGVGLLFSVLAPVALAIIAIALGWLVQWIARASAVGGRTARILAVAMIVGVLLFSIGVPMQNRATHGSDQGLLVALSLALPLVFFAWAYTVGRSHILKHTGKPKAAAT